MSAAFATTNVTVTAVGAQAAIAAAASEATANGWAFAIAVTDQAGDLVALLRMEGALRITVDIAIAKARTAARTSGPSAVYYDRLNKGELFVLAVPGLSPLAGGFPIMHDGVVIGAVGASGGSAVADIQVAEAGARAVSKVD
jgi:glc operon protein GlcG